LNPANLNSDGSHSPKRFSGEDEQPWLDDMAWTTPLYSKNKVNWAGGIIVRPVRVFDDLVPDQRTDAEAAEMMQYFEALDVVNNWRSSHNFPLNTFHVWLKRREKLIDGSGVTAQRIKRLSSIEAKLIRFPTMTLSQMQDIGGCRAILASCSQVKELAQSYADSQIKHALAQKDDYIECPKESGYRGVHLIYRYYSDKKSDYNSLKIEVQLRSQLQHAWATAVETVGAFVQQALKSSIGEREWLRFFALMGTAIATRENATPVPNTPTTYASLVKELREHAHALDIANKLAAFGTALNITESPRTKQDHYFLIEVNHRTKLVSVTSFKQSESEKATAEYLETEKKIRDSQDSDAVLVSVESMAALRRAYPNYFLDTKVFLDLLSETLRSTRAPPRSRQLSLFREE
jgi:ppGpp synthetase/RelA/SpoT-type nucleotidyltranferase